MNSDSIPCSMITFVKSTNTLFKRNNLNVTAVEPYFKTLATSHNHVISLVTYTHVHSFYTVIISQKCIVETNYNCIILHHLIISYTCLHVLGLVATVTTNTCFPKDKQIIR